jgi:hypothetical protein
MDWELEVEANGIAGGVRAGNMYAATGNRWRSSSKSEVIHTRSLVPALVQAVATRRPDYDSFDEGYHFW